MNTLANSHDALKAALISLGDLKVWSLVVTILGDIAARKGAQVTGPALSEIMNEIGIKPEALRVALHRLRKDGWVETEKVGRESRHSLSAESLGKTRAVVEQVYGPPPAPVNERYLIVAAPNTRKESDWVQFAPNSFLSASSPSTVANILNAKCSATPLPNWVAEQLFSQELCLAFEALMKTLQTHNPDPTGMAPHERLALRVLILHCWRRLALREEPQAAALVGAEWIGSKCRAEVHRWLAALPLSRSG